MYVSCIHTSIVAVVTSYDTRALLYHTPEPDDYQALVNDSVEFQPGSTRECADLNIMDDDILEPPETFLVMLDSFDPAVMIIPIQQANVTILDSIGWYKNAHIHSSM